MCFPFSVSFHLLLSPSACVCESIIRFSSPSPSHLYVCMHLSTTLCLFNAFPHLCLFIHSHLSFSVSICLSCLFSTSVHLFMVPPYCGSIYLLTSSQFIYFPLPLPSYLIVLPMFFFSILLIGCTNKR